MENAHNIPPSPLRDDLDAKLPAAAYLRYEQRADGWSAGRQAAFLSHLADNGVVADAARCVGMSLAGGYALRRTARGYAFNLGWEAALIIARRIVADNLMTSAIKGEESRWVREDGVTTYTRQNTKLSLTLLDRINPATALSEVLAVATRFDYFLQMIEEGLSAEEWWDYFFDDALPHSDPQARARVRAALLLSEESAGFEDDDDGVPVEYKSMEGPVSSDAGVQSRRQFGRQKSRYGFLRRKKEIRKKVDAQGLNLVCFFGPQGIDRADALFPYFLLPSEEKSDTIPKQKLSSSCKLS
jgi:hypothetical protein